MHSRPNGSAIFQQCIQNIESNFEICIKLESSLRAALTNESVM